MNRANLVFRKAEPRDAEEMTIVLNGSYRGDGSKEGWTTEADLVGGERTNPQNIRDLIGEKGSHFILAIGSEGQILGCVHVKEENEETVYFGMLAVRPKLQAQGIGRALIGQVQKYTEETGRSRIRISVINFRNELIAYYNRLGFVATGRKEVFPNLKDVKVQGLELLEFIKTI